MDLAELRLVVAQFVARTDLAACALVCKAWNATFQGCVWSEYTLDIPTTVFMTPCTPNLCQVHKRCHLKHAVTKNARHIRRLILPNQGMAVAREFYALFARHCRKLQHVSFLDETREGWKQDIEALFATNPGIQSLSTNGFACLERAMVLPRLRVLEVCFPIANSDVMCVLQKCPHLEELILNQALRPRAWFRAPRPSSLPQASISELNPSFGLKKLSAFLTPSIPYLDIFLASCPRIESIRFSVSRVPLPESALAMLRAHVYQLKSIELVCPVPDSTSPSFILKALSKNPLHTIKVQSPNHDILHIIGRVYSLKVEHIVLSGLSTQATQDIIKILGNCQALRTLRVEMEGRKYVDVRALLGEPWVCQRLESLSMPLALIHRCRDDWLLSNARAEKAELDPECKLSEWLQTENVFMRRLGGLTQLRLLHLSSLNRGQAAKIASLSWRFEGGLHHLAGLTQLQVLHLGEGQLAQGRREVRWMRNHWRSLQRLVVHQLKHRHLFATQWPELTIETLQ